LVELRAGEDDEGSDGDQGPSEDDPRTQGLAAKRNVSSDIALTLSTQFGQQRQIEH
jgi:hypothetical protein